MTTSFAPGHVWITGASTGMGRELAIRFAINGSRVTVSARSEDKLAELASLNQNIVPVPLDVSDRNSVQAAYRDAVSANGPVDCAIFNAAIWHRSRGTEFDHEPFLRSMEINYFGVAWGLEAVMADMAARGEGQIAIVSSVAGYCGLPGSAYYGPTKSALITLAETYRPELQRHGVKLQVVNPGFVKTPLTAGNSFPMPFLMELDDAVDRLMSGLQSSRFEITFPRRMAILMKLVAMLPYPLYFWLMAPMSRRRS